MTCVVGVAEGGRVVLGADSQGACLDPGHREVYELGVPKVFHNGPYLLGYCASYRLGQILRMADLPEPPDDGGDALEDFLCGSFVASLREVLREAGWLELKKGLGDSGQVMVGVHGRLFVIGPDFSVLWPLPSRSYMAIGGGRHHAYGALCALHLLEQAELSLQRRVELALAAAATHCPGVGGPPFKLVDLMMA